MLSKYIPKRYATAMIKHVIAVTLFFPYIYSHNFNKYYQDFILANFFAVLAMIFILCSWQLDLRKNGIFLAGLGTLLIAYNVFATYMNYTYHHWYGEQINTTISFLFFMVLLMVKDPHALIDTSTIKATIHMIVASNVLAIVFRLFTKYNQLSFINDKVDLIVYDKGISDQYAWLYGHKSQYGFILVLCIGFCVFFRHYFRNIFTWVLSLVVLMTALILCNSYTSLACAMLIFIGLLLDNLFKGKWLMKLIYILLFVVCLIYVLPSIYEYINESRNLATLGNRKYIWSSFANLIKENPNGISNVFGIDSYLVLAEDRYYIITNCHNIFLNHAFRFSIPVGGLYVSFFVLISLILIKRSRSFIALGLCAALFVVMSIDHSMMASELTMLLIISYMILKHTTKNHIN